MTNDTQRGYASPFKQRQAKHRYSAKCKRGTPCGAECILNGAYSHSFHSCKDERCICHSRERFRYRGAK